MSNTTNTLQTDHFPNLNALRFMAASMVLVGHTEQIKGWHGYKSYFLQFPFLFQGGHLAVIFFFVLSGFLITHIIRQKSLVNKFSVSDFYKKRIIRIWPLYYFIIMLGLYVLPQIGFMAHDSEWVDSLSKLNPRELNEATFFYFLVLPNISMHYGVFEYLGHTWSIGVEEQFYLIWPLLMKSFKTSMTALLLTVIGSVWVFRVMTEIFDWRALGAFISMFRIDSMAIGGVSAIILTDHVWLKKYVLNRWIELSAILIVVVFYFSNVHFGIISDEVYSILFSLIIINAAAFPQTAIKLERFRLIGYLGQVSYGIYMYHPIVAMLALLIFNYIHPSYMASLTSNLVFYGLVFGMSIATATAYYELVE